ncbi:MAG TPA: alpha/beta hydrolase [Thermoanaerobaculia bacterium]|jgi:pimeloyl-ACP methyl ester carboxylesterase
MSKRRVLSLSLAALLALPALAGAAGARKPPHPSRAKLQPCTVPTLGKDADALCGTYEVWENRAAKSGRRIDLAIVLLPARSAQPKPDPIFFLAGGPGQSATELAAALARDDLRRARDFVFVDQRGTGKSNPLQCDLGGNDDDVQSYLGEMFPVDAVRKCRERLAKVADLTLYTTDVAMDDLDEVRAWLGYDRINLAGGSYGTRAAQVYLRRHPQSVRAAVLSGVVPMDEVLPLSHAAGGQRSLDLLLGWCEKDAACHAKFPRIREDFAAVMDRLAQGPVTVEIRHPRTGKPVPARLSRELVAEGIRWMLYNPGDGARLPLRVHQAANGDFAPLGQASVAARIGMARVLALGLLFSITCAEDIPYIDPAQVPARTAGSFLGDYRVRQQMAACSVWPRARVAPDHREALRSDVPVLLVSGERDPVTPPGFGMRVARHLTRAVHVIVPWGSHGSDDPCIDRIQKEFIDRGSGEGLDTSCVSRIQRTPFVLEKPKGETAP